MNVAPPIERRSSTLARSCAIAVIALPVLSGCRSFDRRGAASAPGQSTRAIWVTRWDYKTPTDVATVMKNCRAAGFNTVLFQVRGNGTAMYRSRIEPWAEELGGRDPGFDPLKLACREAHRQGLKLQAWVNVVPGWRGKGPPDNRRQLYHAHPDWFWRDARNRRQPFGWYNSLNPCYPEVRAYLVSVMREIVTRYDVDGLHLDYIRFPNDWHDSYLPAKAVPDYPRDRRTLALFRRDTGQTPTSNPKAWDRWRTEQITRLVGDIRRMIRRTVPRMTLTAAVGADRQAALRRHFQDTRRWMADGLLDTVFPMNYAADNTTFLRRTRDWSNVRRRFPVVMGVRFDERDGSVAVRQSDIALRGGLGLAVFAYHSLFDRLDARGRPTRDAQSPARADRRKRLATYLRTRARGVRRVIDPTRSCHPERSEGLRSSRAMPKHGCHARAQGGMAERSAAMRSPRSPGRGQGEDRPVPITTM